MAPVSDPSTHVVSEREERARDRAEACNEVAMKLRSTEHQAYDHLNSKFRPAVKTCSHHMTSLCSKIKTLRSSPNPNPNPVEWWRLDARWSLTE